MPSVIIPAHNEAAVIGRCLRALTEGAAPGELEIVVVANGCSDQTSQLAREFSPAVRVIDTPVASKSNALNLGDAVATSFPRFYVDADVVLPLEALRTLAKKLDEKAVLAVAPTPRFELSSSSWPVRAYYQIHQKLPASREGIGGSGVYGLSEQGRRRFEKFPDVTADDGFVRLQFAPSERETVPECHSIVYAPWKLHELIAIKTRSHYGTAELRRRVPGLWGNIGERNKSSLRKLVVSSPGCWPQLAVYAWVKLAARYRARKRLRDAQSVWERDENSRRVAPD